VEGSTLRIVSNVTQGLQNIVDILRTYSAGEWFREPNRHLWSLRLVGRAILFGDAGVFAPTKEAEESCGHSILALEASWIIISREERECKKLVKRANCKRIQRWAPIASYLKCEAILVLLFIRGRSISRRFSDDASASFWRNSAGSQAHPAKPIGTASPMLCETHPSSTS
jgi:hypothetical protein